MMPWPQAERAPAFMCSNASAARWLAAKPAASSARCLAELTVDGNTQLVSPHRSVHWDPGTWM